MLGFQSSLASTKFGTGWISELNPRKGVLTFDNGGHDERVLFLASKVNIWKLGRNIVVWGNRLEYI